jgi:hypothetical protein
MLHERSLPCSKDPANDPSPELDEYSSHLTSCFLMTHLSAYLLIYPSSELKTSSVVTMVYKGKAIPVIDHEGP